MTDPLSTALTILDWGSRQVEHSADLSPAQCRALRDTNALTYLACPYSHPDRAVRVSRFEAANRAAAVLMARGEFVFSPISHTHSIAEAGDLPKGWGFWQAFDRIYLAHSKKVVVLTIDGWLESVGVQAELKIAKEFGLPVEYIEDLESRVPKPVDGEVTP